MSETCTHLDQVRDVTPTSSGCEDCLRIGGWWVHLRVCMSCGHVGCCNDSPNRHTTAHLRSTGHPVIQSYEPGEDWWYCYLDDLVFQNDGAPSFEYS
jgi:uncharacterized UBP type Zn finger protein